MGAIVVPARARAQSSVDFPATPATAGNAGAGATDTGTANPGGAGTNGAATSYVSPIAPPLTAFSPLLPATGTNVRLGDLREQTAAGVAGVPLERATRNWTVSPSFGLGEEYTDNVLATAGGSGAGGSGTRGGGQGRGYDFITLIQPSVTISGQTTRLQGTISYNPEIDVYARNSNETRVDQNFGGSVLATLVPGTLFLDLRGYGAATTNGLAGPSGTGSSITTRNGATQTLSFSASPYAVHRFGPWGTGEVGANLSRTSETALGGGYTATAVSPFATSGNQRVTSYSGHAGFETGEAFGRYDGAALAYATRYEGTGVLSGASRDTFTIDNGYAVDRLVTALARIGYEHIRYGGTSPLLIDDEIWDVGVRVTSSPGSSIEVRYGHHDGLDAASVNATVQPTARTRIYLRYSKGLDTEAQELQSALATSDIDSLGNPVDHTTGAPLLLTNSFYGSQNNLYRSQRVTLTGSLLEDRDVFSVTVSAEDNTLVSSSGLPGSLGSNKGLYGSISWSHDLSPTVSLSAFAQYGVRSTTGTQAETDHVIFGSIAANKALSETLTAQLRYSYNRVSSSVSASNFSENLVLFTLVKSF